MVRAILDGSKTQTRRSLKHQPTPLPNGLFAYDPEEENHHLLKPDGTSAVPGFEKWLASECHHGQPGDRLWVRETFSPWADEATKEILRAKEAVIYRADYRDKCPPLEVGGCEHWKPSIFMPRWASRITLQITGVRVERLNQISVSDCLAEGIDPKSNSGNSAYTAYAALWESINGKWSWSQNLWVWVIEFRKLNLASIEAGGRDDHNRKKEKP
jgi:hypothetical protein